MLRIASAALVLALGASNLEDVPLEFRATDSIAGVISDAASAFKTRKVTVKPFTDERDDKKLIGRNLQDEKPRLVTTKDDVGAWCSTQFTSILRDAGVPVVQSGAELVITGKVTRFQVDEKDVYKGVVALLITVQDAKGKELWSGLVTGEAKRWGRSFKDENYLESLSDALVRAIDGFFGDPKLKLDGDAGKGEGKSQKL